MAGAKQFSCFQLLGDLLYQSAQIIQKKVVGMDTFHMSWAIAGRNHNHEGLGQAEIHRPENIHLVYNRHSRQPE
jgi:hypothetical protein